MSIPPLAAAELALLRCVFSRHPEITEVRLFGSRAKNSHTSRSDIDLAVGGNISPLQAQAIAAELDDLPLPYRYDVQAIESIKSRPLREHVERVGIAIYPHGANVPRSRKVMSAGEAEGCLRELTEGRRLFWELACDISREDLAVLVKLGLRDAGGSYPKVAQLFNIAADEYPRFMNFLRRNDCALDARP